MAPELGPWAEIGPPLVWLVLAGGLAFIVAVAATVYHRQRQPLSSFLLVAAPLFASAGVMGTARLLLRGFDVASAEERLVVVMSFGAALLMGPLVAVPALCVHALAQAWDGLGLQAQGSRRLAALGFLACVLVVAIALVMGGTINPIFAWIRALSYAGIGILLAFGLFAAPERGGMNGAAASAALFPMMVALGEAAERGLAQLLLVQQTAAVTPEEWSAAVDWMLGAVATEALAGWVAVGVASVAAVLGAVAQWEGANFARSGARVAVAVGAVGLAVTYLWGADLGEARLDGLADACGAEADPSGL